MRLVLQHVARLFWLQQVTPWADSQEVARYEYLLRSIITIPFMEYSKVLDSCQNSTYDVCWSRGTEFIRSTSVCIRAPCANAKSSATNNVPALIVWEGRGIASMQILCLHVVAKGGENYPKTTCSGAWDTMRYYWRAMAKKWRKLVVIIRIKMWNRTSITQLLGYLTLARKKSLPIQWRRRYRGVW